MFHARNELGNHKILDLTLLWSLLLLGAALGLVVANFIVDGRWYFGLALILALPALLVLQRYPLLALVCWFLVVPLIVETDSTTLRMLYWILHRALPPLALMVLALTNLLGTSKLTFPRPSVGEVSALGYIAVSLASIFYLNDDPQTTAYRFYDRVIIPVCLYILARLLVPGRFDLHRLMPVLAVFLVSQSFIGLLSWVAPQTLPDTWTSLAGARTTGSLGSYSVFAATVLCLGLLLLHYGQNHPRRLGSAAYSAMFALSMIMVFFSFSRGAWLAGLVVSAGVAYVYAKFAIRLVAVAIPILVIVGTLGVFSGHLRFAQERLTTQETALSRLPVYFAGYQMFLAKPLFGWGYENFDRYDRQFQGRVLGLVNPEKDHASHNVYLTLLAEQGLTGFGLFLAPMVWCLLISIRKWPRLPATGLWSRQLLAILWLCILAHIVVNNFSNMRVVVGWGLWWFLLGLMTGILAPNDAPPQPEPRPRRLRRATRLSGMPI